MLLIYELGAQERGFHQEPAGQTGGAAGGHTAAARYHRSISGKKSIVVVVIYFVIIVAIGRKFVNAYGNSLRSGFIQIFMYSLIKLV